MEWTSNGVRVALSTVVDLHHLLQGLQWVTAAAVAVLGVAIQLGPTIVGHEIAQIGWVHHVPIVRLVVGHVRTVRGSNRGEVLLVRWRGGTRNGRGCGARRTYHVGRLLRPSGGAIRGLLVRGCVQGSRRAIAMRRDG